MPHYVSLITWARHTMMHSGVENGLAFWAHMYIHTLMYIVVHGMRGYEPRRALPAPGTPTATAMPTTPMIPAPKTPAATPMLSRSAPPAPATPRGNGGRPIKKREEDDNPPSPNTVQKKAMDKLNGLDLVTKKTGSNPRRSSVADEDKKKRGKQTSISIWMKVKHIDDFLAVRESGVRYPYSQFLKSQVRKGCYYGCFTKNDGTGWIQRCEDRCIDVI